MKKINLPFIPRILRPLKPQLVPVYLLVLLLYFPAMSISAPLQYMEIKGAHLEKNNVVVEWATLEGPSTWYYILEKSSDGINYTEVDQQTATVPAGADSEVSYRGIDVYASTGTTYYRIQRINWDGEAQYSYAIAFKNEGAKADLQVYPNPFIDRFQLKISCKEEMSVSLVVAGPTGRIFWHEQHSCREGENIFYVTFKELLVKGTYFVKMINNKTGEELFAQAVKNGE